jgi:hypothetical protein
MKNKRFTFRPAKATFGVNPESKILTNVVLLEANREASGHGIYIDEKSLETALGSVQEKGGVLKAYYTHNHRGAASSWWANMTEDSHSELFIPGYFTDIRVEDNKLIAGTFEFFDAFAAEHPFIVAQILEMAEKTPTLIMQSIEFWGYGVYVDEDGNEYQEAPEDTELQYNGMPAVRVVEMFASAFVADGAATSSLFHKLSRKIKGEPGDHEQLRKTLSAWKDELVSEFRAHTSTTTTENTMNIIEQIKSRFGADKSRLSRALLLHAENPDLKVEEIDFRLKQEDREAEFEQLRKEKKELAEKAKKADQLEKELAAEKTRFKTFKESGQDPHHTPNTNGNPDPDVITFTSPTGKRQATGYTAKAASELAAKGIHLAVTTVSDLWTPATWLQGMPEMVTKQTDLLTSPVVVTDPVLDAVATGGGIQGNMPFLAEPDVADEIQVASTAPTINNLSSGNQIVPILNRVSAIGSDALAKAVSASDPIGFAMGIASRLRLRQRQTTLINVLRGLFSEGAADSAFISLVKKSAVEIVGSQTADHFFDSDLFHDATQLLGEAKGKLEFGGVIMMHSVVEAALNKQESIITVRDSQGNIVLKEYKGLRVIINDALVRAGTTSGFVYDTYIFAPGSIGMGDKAQSNQKGDAASLQVEGLSSTNDVVIYDRTRFILQPFGAKWVGSPAGQSATNAELATKANWELAFTDTKNVGVLQVVTNG